MIKALIWDLDDTLLDTTTLLLPIARTPAFEKRIREPLPLLDGVMPTLQSLSQRYVFFLLTYGRPEAQNQKLDSMGIRSFFRACYFADPAKQETKGQYFERIPPEWGMHPSEVMSIGNRRSTDIGEAKDKGLQTCLFLYGEHQDEPIRREQENPDFEVRHHKELIQICRL